MRGSISLSSTHGAAAISSSCYSYYKSSIYNPLILHFSRPLRNGGDVQFQVHAQNEAQNKDNNSPASEDNGQESTKTSSAMSAFERAAAYKKKLGKNTAIKPKPNASISSGNVSLSSENVVKLEDISSDFGNLKSQQEQEMASAMLDEAKLQSGSVTGNDKSQGVVVEIITRDGVIQRKSTNPGDSFGKIKEQKRKGIQSSDFIGLDFSEKKGKTARPPGLAVGLDVPPPGALPEVEIITRDGSASQKSTDGLYKPKVSTWGVFERPANISRTYGGGRNIKPGEPLETEEEKKAREARTKQLLAAYHKKIGLDVDPEIKAACTKALEQGNKSLEKGNIQLAVGYFEKVMEQMPYQSELHGMAALQWAVCLDSTTRFEEARSVYEKIVNHPNVSVRKKAKQLLFGFKAMEALKLSTSADWDTSPYRKYFDAFSDGYNTLYKSNEDENVDVSMFDQAFIYIGFILLPIVMFFIVILLRGK